LGWEECRAWTRLPIERTTQALFVVLGLLRRLRWGLEASGGDGGWLHPPCDPSKTRPSVLDVERLLRQQRAGIQQLLLDWLGKGDKAAPEQVEAVAMLG
jgi:hypothetical protein